MLSKDLTCIVCPLGCKITIEKKGEDYSIIGNKCPRGKDYAIKELTDPRRIIPTTVKIKNAKYCRLPVKTSMPVPKNKIFEIMKIINCIEVEAPISVGDIVYENILNLGIDIVATRKLERIEEDKE